MSASKWSARTMARPWRSPPDRPVTVVSGVSTAEVKPIDSLIALGDAAHLGDLEETRAGLLMGRPMKMFRHSGSCSASARSWKTVSTPSARAFATVRPRTGLPANSDLAAVGLVDAGDDLDERGLAGAVVAEQPTTSPGSRWKSTSSRTCTPPNDL